MFVCYTRTVRDDIKAARAMIADEMRQQDADVTVELAGGRRMGYLKSQAGYPSYTGNRKQRPSKLGTAVLKISLLCWVRKHEVGFKLL